MDNDIKRPIPVTGEPKVEDTPATAGQSIPVFNADVEEPKTEEAPAAEATDNDAVSEEPVVDEVTSEEPDVEAEELAEVAEVAEEPAVETPADPVVTETTEEPEAAEQAVATEPVVEEVASEEPTSEVAEPASEPEASEAPAETDTAETVENEHPAEEPAETTEPSELAPTPQEFDSEIVNASDTPTHEASLNNETPVAEPASEHADTEQTHAPVASSVKMKKIILSVIAVLVVLLLAGAAWALLGNKDAKKTTTTQTFVADITLLRVGDINGPIGTDAIYPNAPGAQLSQQIDFQVYEGLVGYKDQKIVPLLASSWTNPDNNTWVFKIKDGVKFHNGKTLTAQDVKTSLDAIAKDEYWGQFMQTVDSVAASGTNEVTIKTTAPDSLLLNRLVFGFVSQQNADKTISGTGAYTVDAANSKTEDKTRLIAFDNYHQGRPKTRAVQYTVYKDDAAIVADLKNGLLDYASLSKSATTEAELAKKGFKTTTFDESGSYGITMNMIKTGSPLQKAEVRQALSYAMDRATYAAVDKSSVATSYMIPITVVGYDETAKFPEYNSAKAKELVTKAGYPNGVPLTLNYISGIQDEAKTITDILNKSGFKITAKAFPSPKEFVTANSAGNYDLFVGTFSSDLGDGLDIFSGLLGSKTSQFPSYNNPAFDKMLSDASQAFKPEDHVKKVQEINRYVKDNSLWVPITVGSTTIYYHDNYNFSIDAVNALAGSYYWKLGETQTSSKSN